MSLSQCLRLIPLLPCLCLSKPQAGMWNNQHTMALFIPTPTPAPIHPPTHSPARIARREQGGAGHTPALTPRTHTPHPHASSTGNKGEQAMCARCAATAGLPLNACAPTHPHPHALPAGNKGAQATPPHSHLRTHAPTPAHIVDREQGGAGHQRALRSDGCAHGGGGRAQEHRQRHPAGALLVPAGGAAAA